MKAAVLYKLGESPRYAEFADPVAGAEEALVRVRAASLKNVERQQAAGTHYASPREFPVVCGLDGVGNLEDGFCEYFSAAQGNRSARWPNLQLLRARFVFHWPIRWMI